MKKILLISDTHDYLDPLLLKHIEQSDEVWHAGDIGSAALADKVSKLRPFRAVYGNIDGAELRSMFPGDLVFICEGLKVFMTHIGGYPGTYPAKLKIKLSDHKPGLFICGHSHILKIIYDKELQLLHMNPGACGVQGFHQVKTAIKFEIDNGEIKNAAVIELGKRTSLTSQHGS